ncbi:alpha/beta hydrolase [Pseudonocardiaceae bacterium YIM PH 21723]|nr:alpha/beta hydrolase [Pseudonocardiaceae bacterium YIM PH 21723]
MFRQTLTCVLAAALTLLAIPSAQATAVAKAPTTHTFATVGDRALKLKLWQPATAKPAPLVIYVHGGAWAIGSYQGYPLPMPWGTVDSVAGELTAKGYAVASLDYRLSGEAQWPAQIFDVKSGVRYLRANAATLNIDPDRFAAWGDSAGGHLAAMLGTTADRPELEGDVGVTGVSSAVQAVADWFGPTDIAAMADNGGVWEGLMHGTAISPETKLLGCVPQKCRDKADQASPISYVTAKSAPFLIQHGRFDHLVPFNQAELLDAKLRAAGVPVEFRGLLTDHEFVGLANPRTDILNPFYMFLEHQLHPAT